MSETNKDAGQLALLKSDKLSVFERVSRIFVLHPRKSFGVVWAVMFLMSIIVFSQGWFDIAETTTYDWTIAESTDSQNEDALADARTKLDSSTTEEIAPARSKAAPFSDVQIIYEWTNPNRKENILTAVNVQAMCKFQAVMTGHPDYVKFCQTDKAEGVNTVCRNLATDVVAQFYATPAEQKACALLSPVEFFVAFLTFFDIPNDLSKAFFLQRSFVETRTLTATRTNLALGGPLGADTADKSYSSVLATLDATDPQYKVYKAFLVDKIEEDLWKYLGMEQGAFSSAYNTDGAMPLPGSEISVRFHYWYARDTEFQRLVGSDQFLVSGAVFFVGVIMVAHTRSLFITVNGMFSILFSIPVALFIYAGIMRIDYWSDIHIVVIFLVLGIGANDVFVFFDAFRQSKTMWGSLRGIESSSVAKERNLYGTDDTDEEVLIARLAYTLLRASGTLFTTSFTTFAAFMATAISPVIPVAAFGLYAAIAILVNFVFTLVLYPSFAIIYHRSFEGRPFWCACFRKPIAGHGGFVSSTAESDPTVAVEEGAAGDLVAAEETSFHDMHEYDAKHVETCEDKVFSRGYVPLMDLGTNVTVAGKERRMHIVAPITIVGLFVLFLLMGNATFKLETPKQRDEPFGTMHMWSGFLDSFANDFVGGSDYLKVEVTWGIKGINRDGFKKFAPNGERGAVVFDENFDLAPSASQAYVLDVCNRLEQLSCVPEGGTEPLPGCLPETLAVRIVTCTLADFHAWHNTVYNDTTALALGDSDPAAWLERIKAFAKAANREDDVGIVDGKLRFLVMSYESTLKGFSPETVKTPIFEILYGFFDKVREDAPETLKTVFQTSFDMTWTNSEIGIVDGMFQGLAISLPVAYVVVLFATGNLVLSGFVIVTIVSIVACVLGAVYVLGWALGVGEAIAAVMVVGLSVDHSLILGSVYSHLGKEGYTTRYDRFRLSATQMGPTVLAGAVTTGGSAAIMFLCQLQFFTKMASLIALTMGYSLVYTFFFFLALCLLIGPEGEFGNWILFLRRCFGRAN